MTENIIKFPGSGYGLLYSLVFLFGTYMGHLLMHKHFPATSQVQQGFIAPSRLEIECEDLDGNSQPETILKVDDKQYLLHEIDGKLVLSEYQIKIDVEHGVK